MHSIIYPSDRLVGLKLHFVFGKNYKIIKGIGHGNHVRWDECKIAIGIVMEQ